VFPEDDTMLAKQILVIGSSIAGLSAAEAAQATDPDCRITILSEDSFRPYSRLRLCEVLEDSSSAEKLFLHTDSWYKERGILLELNAKVVSIKPQCREVLLADGRIFSYDRLILATGSSSFVPPVKGVDLPGVETLWTMADALRIERKLGLEKRCIVIGGGLLGLEAAYAFHKRGMQSAILERLPRLMMRQLDERSAEIFTAWVEKEGSPVTINAFIAEIFADREGHAAGVRLEDGSEYPADLVFISAGVRARTEMLEGSGIAMNRWIAVDSRMRTNLPDIYAAGDCAALKDHWYGLWMVARQQGTVAGANAAGGEKEYVPLTPPYMVNTMGTHIASAGLIDEKEVKSREIAKLHADIMENSEKFQYAKKIYAGDKLTGFILLGDTKAFAELNKALGS
jgi:NAD(P)H-nitrite reductase large subunit